MHVSGKDKKITGLGYRNRDGLPEREVSGVAQLFWEKSLLWLFPFGSVRLSGIFGTADWKHGTGISKEEN